MKIGIIGIGSMGSMLTRAFIDSLAVIASNLYITNRGIENARKIKNQYPNVNVVGKATDVIVNTDIIFLCVKPLQMHPILEELEPKFSENQLLVSITSPISVSQLENLLSCQVARAIPSITNSAFAGSSLLTFGNRCSDENRQSLTSLMQHISTPVLIEENITRIASDIASCGPAFLNFLVQSFINSAVKQSEISKEQATILASEMIIGFGKLLEKEIFTIPTLQERVNVPGGIIGEGLKVLQAELGEMFDHLFQQTYKKYREDMEKIQEQYRE